ncbi:MAG: Phosphoenolpyruvate carboxylase [Frankiales bacterium]|nr:Phosphoenolpyruvate carboxylase [Frankiales bacterium]
MTALSDPTPSDVAVVSAGRLSARDQTPPGLRADVRLLGELLGRILVEYGGEDLLADVERLRQAVIAARYAPSREAEQKVQGVVESFDLDRAELVARAFTVYFHLANLAEEQQRVRKLRTYDSTVASAGSLRHAVETIAAEEGDDKLAEDLAGLVVHPVLTAHPTEARRRAVVTALARITEQLDRYGEPGAGTAQKDDAYRRLAEEISILWRTAQLRQSRPGPLDEVRATMAVFDETLFRVVPRVYRAVEAAVAADRSTVGRSAPDLPAFLRFGSWVGGDRDGNPHVTADITLQAMAIQADHVLRALENAATRIGRSLTLDDDTTPGNGDLVASLHKDAEDFPSLFGTLERTAQHEPHRQKMLLIVARIVATRLADPDHAYTDPAHLLADLRLVQRSLADGGADRVAYGELQQLIWQAETFGFHLAELEIRQHSAVHRAALADILGPDHPAANGDAAAIDAVACGGAPLPGTLTEQTHEVLATFRAMAALRAQYGPGACSRYIVSFTRSAADLATVHALARCAVPEGLAIDAVPLFETGEDLSNAVAVLDEALALESMKAQLSLAGRRLEVMIGYSDSAKDVGPVSASLALYDTQGRLAEWATRNDIELTLFHGRGGALGRGGGPANRAVLSQAPGSVAGRFKVTEQGEVIFARYGNLPIAQRHLEQVTSAVLLASTPTVMRRAAAAAEKFAVLADQLAEAARVAYRSLVDTEGFAAYFERVSPIEELASLQIGSRPARRSSSKRIEDLRAIPWVFAWAQTRCNLPGWFGLGSGLLAVAESDDGMAHLRQAYRDWPLFGAMLDNAEMSLAKTDRIIASEYLALGDRPDLAKQILDELDLTTRLVLAVTEHDRLLQDKNVLSWAVELRNPYVDALSQLQLRALRALRAGTADPTERARLERLVLLTVNGVAAGLQNTG